MNSSSRESSSAKDARRFRTRVLCLGNDLLADDSFAKVVHDHIREFFTPEVEVVSTPESGFHLLDYVSNTQHLIVVDTIMTGRVPPGTILVFQEQELQAAGGGSPHYIGLCEALALARQLGLEVAEDVMIVAVEAADCTTVGGEMHSAVRAAVPSVIRIVRSLIHDSERTLSSAASG